MYYQHTTPVLIWSNLILDLCEISRCHVSLKSNYSKLTFLLMYQTNTIPMILNGDQQESLRSKNLKVFYYFVLFYDKYSFCSVFQ